MTTTTRQPKARKTVTKMHIRTISTERGLYTASSATYGDWLLYDVRVLDKTCTCEGNAKWGRFCHHLKFCTAKHEWDMAERDRAEQAARDAKMAAARSSYGSLADAFGA